MTSTSSWKALFVDVLHSSYDPVDAGIVIAPTIGSLDGPSSLEDIAIHLLNEAIKHPAKIDELLSVYTSIAEALSNDFEEGGWKGKHAARKALGIQLSECTQSLNPVLNPIFVDLLDDNCRNIPSESNSEDVAEVVRQMAENRRAYIIAAAVYGCARAVDAVMEDDPEYDMAIVRIEHSLGLQEGIVQVEANHIAAGKVCLKFGGTEE
ncbi:hypothetical protein VKT23_007738 [Stygiomarasmius scandens]|uniref:Uncharacterized protein n=1 Tax=Marasmiellus scandens TaxID=2682957 RepID=A0ABR1JJE9_9AGAR